MNPADNDPLEQLPSLPTPDADAAHQRATMASSRAEFLRLAHSANATPGWLQNWRDRLELLPGWLVPGGFGLAGILVALAILPIVLTPQPDGTSPLSEPTLAEAPPAEIAAPAAPTTPPGGSVRMGAQPPVQTRSLQPEIIVAPDVPVSFENELVTLSARPEDGNLAIYQLRDGQQRLLGQIAASPDQTIVDALSYPRPAGEPEIIGVATATPGQAPAWTVFLVDQAGARIDPGLTTALSSAADRADAEQRITAALLE